MDSKISVIFLLLLSSNVDSDSLNVLPIDGGWSDWSPWSNCTTNCGAGEQTRYRMCNNPTPNFGGAFCTGDSFQRKPCEVLCPDSIPYTPLYSPSIDERCVCGCQMTEDVGEITASGRCERMSQWLVTVPEEHVIKLRFNYLNLYDNQQWVRVRDGKSINSDLIAFSDGRENIDHVTSSTNHMLIQFYSKPSGNSGNNGTTNIPTQPTKLIHVHGFIATYTSNRTSVTVFPISISPVKGNADDNRSIWESTVTIVGIALCGLVVITAAAFVIYHRTCHKREHRYKMAAHEESPRRMCKSTSMRSTPSHESHHGIEIEDNMEIPLTTVCASDKKKAKTPGSTRSKGSFSSACSSNAKKFRTKADVEYGGSLPRTSPLSPQRDYYPVPQDASPRRHILKQNTEVSQESEHMSLFRTSPLLKPKVPRSPKVHPSPKLKHFSQTKTPVNGECSSPQSKHSVLSQRFEKQNPGPQRIVMGSDYTPTNSVKSPPSDCSRTDGETPTNINNDIVLRKHKLKAENFQKESESKDAIAKPSDIKLRDLNQTNDEHDRKPASGTSDESGSYEKDAGSQMTTSFIENGTKPRRPTSLTESYSKMSISSALSRASADGCKEKDKNSVTSSDDRQNILPKPDGQSPKSQRVENLKTESQNGSPVKTSKASTPRSVRSIKSDKTDESNNTKSPARSVNTPSDTIELEYDDFIDMDDTYSYFDPVETEKLTWHGVERVTAKTPNKDTAINGEHKS